MTTTPGPDWPTREDIWATREAVDYDAPDPAFAQQTTAAQQTEIAYQAGETHRLLQQEAAKDDPEAG